MEFTQPTLSPEVEDGQLVRLRLRFALMADGREILFGGTVDPIEGRFLTRTLYEVHRAALEMQERLLAGDERLLDRLSDDDANAIRAEWERRGTATVDIAPVDPAA